MKKCEECRRIAQFIGEALCHPLEGDSRIGLGCCPAHHRARGRRHHPGADTLAHHVAHRDRDAAVDRVPIEEVAPDAARGHTRAGELISRQNLLIFRKQRTLNCGGPLQLIGCGPLTHLRLMEIHPRLTGNLVDHTCGDEVHGQTEQRPLKIGNRRGSSTDEVVDGNGQEDDQRAAECGPHDVDTLRKRSHPDERQKKQRRKDRCRATAGVAEEGDGDEVSRHDDHFESMHGDATVQSERQPGGRSHNDE